MINPMIAPQCRKLKLLKEGNSMKPNSLEKFRNQSLLVVGDMMVDKYIMGSVERISPEAPVPVLRQQKVTRKLGGTGNVLINAISLGAKVRAVGCVGNDVEGTYFRECLRTFGIDDSYIFQSASTIVKTRVSASNQQFIRIDEETITLPSAQIVQNLISEVDKLMSGITVVIISDYAKGFVTEEVAQIVIKAARERNIPVLVDPKGKSAGKYKGATAITPNNKEFLDLTGLSAIPDEETIAAEGKKLCENNGFKYLVFTRSEKGISTVSCDSGEKCDYPAVVKELVDVTGAGDTVVTTIALALGAGFSMSKCVKIANLAASIVISRFGAAQTTIAELTAAMYPKANVATDLDEILAQISLQKSQGKRIVFTNGCFDIVHAGHISSFYQAREFGDVLIVGVNSDDSIRRIKGEKRPIVDLPNRIALLSALKCVDYVIPFEDDTPQKLIELIKPDVLVKGKDWEGKTVAGGDFVRANGGTVEFINLEQGLSTTNIINKILHSVQ